MTTRRGDADDALELRFEPLGDDRRLPIEVLERSDLLRRVAGRDLSGRHRAQFHQLVVCTSGAGTYQLDYAELDVNAGTVLRMYPGQVHRFNLLPTFDGPVVRWPADFDTSEPGAPRWYPGGTADNRFEPDAAAFDRLTASIAALRDTQSEYDGSPRFDALLRSMLCATMLRLAIDTPELSVDRTLPEPYVALRELIEDELAQRPTVSELARRLGYSTKTLDRACRTVSGQTAKQVLDQRVALEIRRLLTHSEIPLSRIAADLHFTEQSSFTNYVKRLLGATPTAIRDRANRPSNPKEPSPNARSERTNSAPEAYHGDRSRDGFHKW